MVQDIKGKGSNSGVHHLKDDHGLLTHKGDIANKLGETLAKHSSSSNYNPQFQKYKNQQEKKTINFYLDNGEDFNEVFSLHELKPLNRNKN